MRYLQTEKKTIENHSRKFLGAPAFRVTTYLDKTPYRVLSKIHNSGHDVHFPTLSSTSDFLACQFSIVGVFLVEKQRRMRCICTLLLSDLIRRQTK